MYPPRFDYVRPSALDEALELLAGHGADAKVLAGGQSVIPLMKLRLASPAVLVDINRLAELEVVGPAAGGRLRIGALVRHHAVEIAAWPPELAVLRDAARVIGDPQVRNVGTVGGALAEVDPAGDWGPVMLALDAEVHAVRRDGERAFAVEDLFADAYTSTLAEDEILRDVEVPVPPAGVGTAYLKMERKAGDFAIASVAVRVAPDQDGWLRATRIGLGGVGLVPLRAREAEGILEGAAPDPAVIAGAAEAVRRACEPIADLRGSADFKRQVAGVLFARALDLALRRARGETVEAGHV